MKILTAILNFFKKAFSKEYLPITLAIIVLILLILNVRSCRKANELKKINEQEKLMNENNLKAMKDTIFTYYDKKLNQFVSEKTSYMVKDMEDLKLYNQNLYNEMKNIKGVLAGITSTISVLGPIGEAVGVLSQTDTNQFKITFKKTYADAGFEQNITGNTKFRIRLNKPYDYSTYIDTNQFKVRIDYAFKEEGKQYKVWATSPSKLVKFDELNGALFLDKMPAPIVKEKPWTFGPCIGIGLTTDIKGMNSRLGWMVGVSLNYKLFRF